MARIVCLANSKKHQGRCIAGIDIDTGEWIRPVSHNGDAIYNERFIDGKDEPQLLDLLEIPLGGQAPDRGCQPENRFLGNGAWRLIRHLSVSDIDKYVDDTENLLHNQEKKVDPEIFKQISRNEWRSLQLIRVHNPNFRLNPFNSQENPICSFSYSIAI